MTFSAKQRRADRFVVAVVKCRDERGQIPC